MFLVVSFYYSYSRPSLCETRTYVKYTYVYELEYTYTYTYIHIYIHTYTHMEIRQPNEPSSYTSLNNK